MGKWNCALDCMFCGRRYIGASRNKYCSLFCAFWHDVGELREDGCVPWIGTRLNRGYGTLTFRNRQLLATHVCLRLHGIVLGDLNATHSCNRPWCVALEHIIPDTQSRNLQYAYAQNRGRWQR